jgi:hypothetical protein
VTLWRFDICLSLSRPRTVCGNAGAAPLSYPLMVQQTPLQVVRLVARHCRLRELAMARRRELAMARRRELPRGVQLVLVILVVRLWTRSFQ